MEPRIRNIPRFDTRFFFPVGEFLVSGIFCNVYHVFIGRSEKSDEQRSEKFRW